jgi:hypothetical protein
VLERIFASVVNKLHLLQIVRVPYLLLFLLTYSYWGAAWQSNLPEEIVQRSVANTNADWAAASQFDFTERDVITQHGTRTVKAYQVMIIEGSPYNKLITVDGRKLSSAQAAEEEKKLQREIRRRLKETPAQRRKRVAGYESERRQDHALLSEMIKAFQYKLVGEETVNGRRCFALEASPRPGYRPSSHETQVLLGMRGKLWIDAEQYQWVKVYAEVFHPVTFGLFFATVKPGTEFLLEQMPVQGKLWMPSHFSMQLNARVLLWARRTSDDETYSNYYPVQAMQAKGAMSQP